MSNALLKAHERMTADPAWPRYVEAFHAFDAAKGKAARAELKPELDAAEAAWNAVKDRELAKVRGEI